MRPNELWTCPDDGAARAQAPGCQRSSCRSNEEEEEGIGVTSDVVKVEGEDPDTPGYQRGDRVRLGRQRSRIVGVFPFSAHNEAPGPYITIPQYWFNKTKQHTHTKNCRLSQQILKTVHSYEFLKSQRTQVSTSKLG